MTSPGAQKNRHARHRHDHAAALPPCIAHPASDLSCEGDVNAVVVIAIDTERTLPSISPYGRVQKHMAVPIDTERTLPSISRYGRQLHLHTYGRVQKVCTRNATSLRHPCSCNTVVTNVEVQDADFLDTPVCLNVVAALDIE